MVDRDTGEMLKIEDVEVGFEALKKQIVDEGHLKPEALALIGRLVGAVITLRELELEAWHEANPFTDEDIEKMMPDNPALQVSAEAV